MWRGGGVEGERGGVGGRGRVGGGSGGGGRKVKGGGVRGGGDDSTLTRYWTSKISVE